MSEKSIIFDWGGVLMHTVNYEARYDWDRRLGLTPGTVEQIVHGIDAWQQVQRGELSLAAYWDNVGNKLDLSPPMLAQLREDFYSGDQLNTELLNLIRTLHREGVPVGLLSNNTPDLADTLQEEGLVDLFKAVIISADIGIMKPHPAAYHAVLDAMQVAPKQALFVDDFIENVRGALAVGMSALHYTPDLNAPKAIKAWLGE